MLKLKIEMLQNSSFKKLIITFLLLVFSSYIFAQSLIVSVSKNKVSLGEYIKVEYKISGGSDSGFRTGNFKDFEIAQGPNSSSNMQWINGKFSQSKTYSYILRPKKEGVLLIPAATVKIKGKSYNSKATKITVVKDALFTQQQKKAKEKQGKIEDFVFLRVEAPKDTIYKGEQLIGKL